MRKLILGMVFVFATGTMMNANNTIIKENVLSKFTFEQCDAWATVHGALYGASYEDEHNMFLGCMDIE